MPPNFEECSADFLAHAKDLYSQYIFNGTDGTVAGGIQSPLITVEGCKRLCGSGTQYYPWYVLADIYRRNT